MQYFVAPFAGAWIEITIYTEDGTPLDGRTLRGCVDWNTIVGDVFVTSPMSHPSRVRGLKYWRKNWKAKDERVAPFAGAWIEIYLSGVTPM